MKRSIFSSVIGLSLLVLGGCSVGNGSDSDSVAGRLKVCTRTDGSCAESNCDELNHPFQGPGSFFGLRHTDWGSVSYKVVGFRPPSEEEVHNTGDKRWIVRGYYVDAGTHTYGEGRVAATTYLMKSCDLVDMYVRRSELRVNIIDIAGVGESVADAKLQDLRLALEIPNPATRGAKYFDWSFAGPPSELGNGWSYDNPIMGYPVNWDTKGAGGPFPLCAGKAGVAQRAVFTQGYFWDPTSFDRGGKMDDRTVTVTCELGAIASCRNWGYSPWTEGNQSFDGQAADMSEIDQTCIRMKTADYCGQGLVHTEYGTPIVINTPIEKVRHIAPQPRLEALWTAKGAMCVIDNNRRHANILFPCDAAIPQCDQDQIDKYSKFYMTSGLQ